MSQNGLTIRSVAEDGALVDKIEDLVELIWPRFIRDGSPNPAARYHGDYMGIYRRWPDCQLAFLNDDKQVVASLQCCPLAWDGDEADLPDDGWDWQVQTAAEDLVAGREPKTLGAVAITIHPSLRGRGLSSEIVGIMRTIGVKRGLRRLIAPVRPTQKSLQPFLSMEEYLALKTPDGYSIDPWIRTHERLGAHVVKPCERSMQIVGKLDDWRRWTGLPLDTTGPHAVPGALSPVQVDLDADQAYYVEPNVWMVHDLAK